MARRGRKRKIKLKLKKDSLRSVLTVILLLSAGVSLVSFFLKDYPVNETIQEYFSEFFGNSAIFIPFILLMWGLLYVRVIKSKFVNVRILFGLVGVLLGFAGLFHIFSDAGGIVGEKIVAVLSSAVSVYGAGLILVALVVVSLIFIFDISFDQIFAFVIERFKQLKELRPKKEKGDKEEKEDIKISSGVDILDKDENAAVDKKKDKKKTESSFEIIPSLSEPHSSGGAAAVGGVAVDGPVASALPYTDKVWEPPPLDLLIEPTNAPVDRGDVKARANIIEDTLNSFGVDSKVVEINFGPSVTQYALETASGTKIARISSLQYDLALAMASPTGSVRIEAPIPGRSLIGIEVPNTSPVTVNFKSVFTSDAMKGMKPKLGIVLGLDVAGQAKVANISKMPHLLVAGATGSGKSVFLHSLIFSLLYRCSPMECKFIFIDPKRVELVQYREIPHLLTPVVTDAQKAATVFRWAVAEMERRYKLLESARARNIDMYNEKSGFQALPYILIIVDELGEIMVSDPAAVEKSIIRLAQLARATGIHLILSVQRPSTNVITGLIKANIPCRVAFNVTSQVDSRVIIDQPGAEKLLGKGDMLFVPPDASKPTRIQGSMVEDEEINRLVKYLKGTGISPEYKEDVINTADSGKSVAAGGSGTDALFDDAIEVVTSSGKASASLLQRRLSIGYARAARILDELEEKGIIGPSRGSKPREVLRRDAYKEDLGASLPGEIDPQKIY